MVSVVVAVIVVGVGVIVDSSPTGTCVLSCLSSFLAHVQRWRDVAMS